MSVLVVGLSHRSAPLSLLERTALTGESGGPGGPGESGRPGRRGLLAALAGCQAVDGAAVLATCNRLEVYAQVGRFHAAVSEIAEALAQRTGVPLDELVDHLYVHYDDAAVRHAFTVACGLDSMAIGEAQILGQLRETLNLAQDGGWCSTLVGQVLQQALRVGKRARAQTGLDRAGGSLVAAGLERAEQILGPAGGWRCLVLGAGAMGGLVVSTLAGAQVAEVVIASRTSQRAARLAGSVGAGVVELTDLPAALAGADLVLATAGATGHLVGVGQARAALLARQGRPQVYVDLALPRDVDPQIADLPGAELVDLESLGRILADHPVQADLAAVRAIIDEEVAGFAAQLRAGAVAPTVVALRERARSVVEAELARLDSRLGEVDERVRAELVATVHRVVEKLLHTPTVRVKQLAGEQVGDSYAVALRALFDLDPEVPVAGTVAAAVLGRQP